MSYPGLACSGRTKKLQVQSKPDPRQYQGNGKGEWGKGNGERVMGRGEWGEGNGER